MYGRGSLSLDRLLIYSDIYGLGLVDSDITHLRTVFTAFKGQAKDMIYIYKAATDGYDLILALDDRSEPFIDITAHSPVVDTTGYPSIAIGNIYLKFLPQVTDLKLIEAASTFIPQEKSDVDYIFNNVDEIKEHVINIELPHYHPDYYHPLDENKIDLIYLSCGQTPPKFNPLKKDYQDVPAYVYNILGVITIPKSDDRIAFYVSKKKNDDRYYSGTFELPMNYYITKVGDAAYNWTDPDRWFSHINKDTNHPMVFYTDKDPLLPKEKDAIDSHRRGAGILTLDNQTLDIIVKRWLRRQQDIENEHAAVKSLAKKIADRIIELEAGKEFSYNDVTFRKNEFEYESQIMSCTDIEMKSILGMFSGNYSEDYLNFDRVQEFWLQEIFRTATKKIKTVRGKIGDVTFAVQCNKRVSKTGIEAYVYYVNGNRINREEVVQVLGRAICFPDNGTFDEFCDTVAACSLKYHKYLAGGILVNTHDEIFNQQMEFKISLERTKNKNYITFNGKKFKIGNTNKLLTLLNAKGMVRVIDLLLDPTVAGLASTDIQHLLTTGRQALIDQRNREEELLKSTMDMFAIEKVDNFRAQNGKALSGYLVKGAIRNYVIEEAQLLVYEHPTGRYICMVDKGQNEHTNTTRLVNRFYALSNDSKLAKEISTL